MPGLKRKRMMRRKPLRRVKRAVVQRGRWALGPSRSLTVGPMNAMPRSIRTTMRYYEYAIALNPGAGGVPDQFVFSANGIYDPNITGTGHQPSGFDQIMTFYDHYTVLTSKITVDFQNTDATNEAIAFVGLRDSANVIGGNLTGQVESGACDVRFLSKSGNSKSTTRVTLPCHIGSYLGKPNPLQEDNLKGSDTSNPAEQVYFLIGGWPNSTSDAGLIGLTVIIDYDVVFHERKSVASS